MTFRKESIAFSQLRIGLIAISLLCLFMWFITAKAFFLGSVAIFALQVFTASRLFHEYITIDEHGVSCRRKDQIEWAFEWCDIEELRPSRCFRYLSVIVVLKDPASAFFQTQAMPPNFQLGSAAKRAIAQYYNKQKKDSSMM